MPIVLVINGRSQRCDSQIVSIGSSPDNTICIPNDARVLPSHAVMRAVAGRWIVESKDGGPLRVGSGRAAQFAWINPGDVIYLTESGPELIFEPDRVASGATAASPVASPVVTAQVPSVVPPASFSPVMTSGNSLGQPISTPAVPGGIPPANAAPATASSPVPASGLRGPMFRKWDLYIYRAGVAAILLIMMGVILSGKGKSPNPQPEKSETAGDLVANPVPSPNRLPTPNENAPGEMAPAATDPKLALFRLEMQSADGKRAVQLGTAWAVGGRRLVTTGDAARGIELNRQFYPVAIARHSVTREAYEIKATMLHPMYESSARRLDQTVREIERLKSEYEQAQEPADRQKIEGKLRQLDTAAILAADEAVNVNVAVIDVAKDISAALTWADSRASSAKIGQRLVLLGHPLPRRNVLVDPDNPIPPQQRVGRLQHTESSVNAQMPGRWLVGFDDPMKAENWSGSPVLDSKGVVMGVYARPTPRLPGAPAGAVVTHDVAVAESLRALMTKPKSTP